MDLDNLSDSDSDNEYEINNRPIPEIKATDDAGKVAVYDSLSDLSDNFDSIVELYINFEPYHQILKLLCSQNCEQLPNISKHVNKITHYPIIVDQWPPKLVRLVLRRTAVVEPVPELPVGCEVVCLDIPEQSSLSDFEKSDDLLSNQDI